MGRIEAVGIDRDFRAVRGPVRQVREAHRPGVADDQLLDAILIGGNQFAVEVTIGHQDRASDGRQEVTRAATVSQVASACHLDEIAAIRRGHHRVPSRREVVGGNHFAGHCRRCAGSEQQGQDG